MKKNDEKQAWLSIDFFCSVPYWNQLLLKLAAFLNTYEENNNIHHTYQLEFNSAKEEYISFSYLLLTEIHPEITTEIKNVFSLFNPVIEYADVKSFKPNNTIDQYYLPNVISRSAIEVLKSDTITNEVKLTFAFHLYIGFLRVILTNNQISLNDISDILGYRNRPVSEHQYNDLLNTQFQDNEEYLIVIAKEILNNEPQGWLKLWIDACAHELIQKSNYSADVSMLYAHNRIIYIIIRHLGIDRSQEMILAYFVQQIINNLSTILIAYV